MGARIMVILLEGQFYKPYIHHTPLHDLIQHTRRKAKHVDQGRGCVEEWQLGLRCLVFWFAGQPEMGMANVSLRL